MSLSIHIQHRFPGFDLDVAFDAPAGVTALFGHSGAGKTTVVNAVAGLLTPASGRINVGPTVYYDHDSRLNLPSRKRNLGYVFQDGRLFPHLTVRENLTYGWKAKGERGDPKGFERIIALLDIAPLLNRAPESLSGGEKQRVAIGRALLSKAELLLMDEPLASLDQARRTEILPYLEALRDETDIPILYVSHSMSEVARLATYIVVLEAGRVVRQGTAQSVLSDPSTVPLMGVQEAGSILNGTVLKHHPDGLTEVQVSSGSMLLPGFDSPTGSTLRIRIEARDVMLSLSEPTDISALNILKATVRDIRQGAGPGVMVQLSVGDDLLLARLTRRSAERMGLSQGTQCYGIIKSVAVAKLNVGSTAE
jgi:molybdate transport system ATP-binding protein